MITLYDILFYHFFASVCDAIFFPGIIRYNFFLLLLIYGGFGGKVLDLVYRVGVSDS